MSLTLKPIVIVLTAVAIFGQQVKRAGLEFIQNPIQSALKERKSRRSLKIIHDGGCTYGELPEHTNSLLSQFYNYFHDVKGPLERTSGSNPCPLIKTLVNLTSGIIQKDQKLSNFEFVKRTLIKSAKGGLFGMVEKKEDKSKNEREAFGRSRSVMAHLQVSTLDRDFLFNEGMSCPLALSWPMQWKLRPESNQSAEFNLEINALPALRKEDGSYELQPDSLRPSWKALLKTNMEFFTANNFRAREILEHDAQTQLHKYHFEVSDHVFECTKNYVRQNCSVLSTYSESNMCEDWGAYCGIFNIFEMTNRTGPGVTTSHLLYLPARTYGIVKRSGTDTDTEAKMDKASVAFLSSLRGFPRDSRAAARESITYWQQSQIGYVPKVTPEQDTLTFLMLFLTCLSEWVFSNPLWSWRVWRSLKMHAGPRQKGNVIHSGTREGCRRRKKLRIRCLLLLPALITYIPLVIGFVLSRQRERARVGLMAAGYAFEPYRGFRDTGPEFESFLMGRTFAKSFVYVEDSAFESLGAEYLVALSIMTFFILFSLGALVIEFGSLQQLEGEKSNEAQYHSAADSSDSVVSVFE